MSILKKLKESVTAADLIAVLVFCGACVMSFTRLEAQVAHNTTTLTKHEVLLEKLGRMEAHLAAIRARLEKGEPN